MKNVVLFALLLFGVVSRVTLAGDSPSSQSPRAYSGTCPNQYIQLTNTLITSGEALPGGLDARYKVVNAAITAQGCAILADGLANIEANGCDYSAVVNQLALQPDESEAAYRRCQAEKPDTCYSQYAYDQIQSSQLIGVTILAQWNLICGVD